MNEVSKVCSREDHHPEWNLKGHTLNVFLTSHFNDNKVSLKDYQLAAAMNDQYNETGPLAGYHPNDRAYAVEIGIGIFFLGIGYYYLKNLRSFNDVYDAQNLTPAEESLTSHEVEILDSVSNK